MLTDRGLFVRTFASQPKEDTTAKSTPSSDNTPDPKPAESQPGRLLYSAPQRLKFFGIGVFGAVQTISAVLYAIILGFQPDYTMFEARSFVIVLLSAVTILYWVLTSAYRSHVIGEIISFKDGKLRIIYHGFFGALSVPYDVPAEQVVPLILSPAENEKNSYYMCKVPGIHGVQMLPKAGARFAELNQWGNLQSMFSGVNPAKKHKPIKPDPVPPAAKPPSDDETIITPPPPPPPSSPPIRQPQSNASAPPAGAAADNSRKAGAQSGKKAKQQQQQQQQQQKQQPQQQQQQQRQQQ